MHENRFYLDFRRDSCYITFVVEPYNRKGASAVKVSYSKLWKLLIDKKMNKTQLQTAAGVSTTVIAKLSKGRCVTTDVLLKICTTLDCDFADIMEVDRSEESCK